MDAPFPETMLEDIRRILSQDAEIPEGQDLYEHVFDCPTFMPLQRKQEMIQMMQLVRAATPKVLMDIGTDKGGGLYHWCKGISGLKRVIACEARGTPYAKEFEHTFPQIEFLWLSQSSYAANTPVQVQHWLHGEPIDVLFMDGDKNSFNQDFMLYLPWMRSGGLVLMHDIQDTGPLRAFMETQKHPRVRTTKKIIDITESTNVSGKGGAYEDWLRYWKGRSCGVGVIHLVEEKTSASPPLPSSSPRVLEGLSLNAMTVCVNYTDYLQIGIERWRPHLASWVIVTDLGDEQTAALAKEKGLVLWQTNIFYANGAAFNKGAAMEEARRAVLPWEDWILFLDPDIIPEPGWYEKLCRANPQQGFLYGCPRYQCNDLSKLDDPKLPGPIHEAIADGGYFQMFHSTDPPARGTPLLATDFLHAGNYDSVLRARWGGKIRPLPLRLMHIGQKQEWWGRGNQEAFQQMMAERKRRGGWAHETVGSEWKNPAQEKKK